MSDPRNRIVAQIQKQLERAESPRVQMSVLVLLTGGAGFIASAVLLNFGLTSMGWRYLSAFGVAYLAFLLLLRLWIALRRDETSALDIADAASSGSPPQQTSTATHLTGSGSGDASPDAAGDALGSLFGADELAIPFMLLVAVVALLGAALYVVYAAPALFAELLLDAGLAAGLYHRLHKVQTDFWLSTALRRTALPFAVTALLVAGAGAGAQALQPGARSLAEVLHPERIVSE